MAGLTSGNRLRIAWAVALAGTLALIVAQFTDYTGFEIGAGGPAGANEVAPPPIAFTEHPGPDQLWLGLIAGVAALAALWFSWRGQWRLGRSVMIAGTVTAVLSLAILLPNATDGASGAADAPEDPAVAYAATSEKLLGGFWLQLAGSAAMIGGGVAMARWSPRRPVSRARASRRTEPAR